MYIKNLFQLTFSRFFVSVIEMLTIATNFRLMPWSSLRIVTCLEDTSIELPKKQIEISCTLFWNNIRPDSVWHLWLCLVVLCQIREKESAVTELKDQISQLQDDFKVSFVFNGVAIRAYEELSLFMPEECYKCHFIIARASESWLDAVKSSYIAYNR